MNNLRITYTDRYFKKDPYGSNPELEQ